MASSTDLRMWERMACSVGACSHDCGDHKIHGRGIYLGQQRLVSVAWHGPGRSRLHTAQSARRRGNLADVAGRKRTVPSFGTIRSQRPRFVRCVLMRRWSCLRCSRVRVGQRTCEVLGTAQARLLPTRCTRACVGTGALLTCCRDTVPEEIVVPSRGGGAGKHRAGAAGGAQRGQAQLSRSGTGTGKGEGIRRRWHRAVSGNPDLRYVCNNDSCQGSDRYIHSLPTFKSRGGKFFQ
jgi:hypothetical protein